MSGLSRVRIFSDGLTFYTLCTAAEQKDNFSVKLVFPAPYATKAQR